MEPTSIANADIRELVVRSFAHVLGTSCSYRPSALGARTGDTLAPARLAKLANVLVGEFEWPHGGATLSRMLVVTPTLHRLPQRFQSYSTTLKREEST